MFQSYKFKYYDLKLILPILALSTVGFLAVRSATMGKTNEGLETKQLVGIIIGVIFMIGVSLVDYHVWLRLQWVIYVATIAVLGITLVPSIGKVSHGARRWLQIPVIGRIQPSEFGKIAMIICISSVLYFFRKKINSVGALVLIVIYTLIPLALIYKQPDLSTTIVYLFLFIVLLFTAKISYKWVLGALAVAVPALFFGIKLIIKEGSTILEQYQVDRILAWINPAKHKLSDWYQQENSIMAIGSGKLLGKGLNNTSVESVKTGNYIVEAQTDFIYAIIGEELGFVGACAVIILLALITFECLWIAKNARDLSGTLIATGMAALIAIQSFINIAVATGMIPNTGLALPFVSAGLSSLISMFIGMGIVLNIGLQRRH